MPVATSRSRLAASRTTPPPVATTTPSSAVKSAMTSRSRYAKPRFALFLEDVADVDAGALLDLGVAIEELLAEQGREPPPDGGLSGAHGPDEIDVTLAEHGCVGY